MSRNAGAAAASPSSESLPRTELYAYQVRREGRVVARLRRWARPTARSSSRPRSPGQPPAGRGRITRPFEFPDADYARRFVDEALLALEYLNCEVVE